VKAGGFSASSPLYDGPLGIHVPGVKIASNNKNCILTTYTTSVDLRRIDRAVRSRIDRGEGQTNGLEEKIDHMSNIDGILFGDYPRRGIVARDLWL
jgi:predicted Zn-dependent protease